MTAIFEQPARIKLSREPAVEAAPLAALGLREMPTETHFRRDHFGVPDAESRSWTLELVGADGERLSLTIDDVERLPPVSLGVVLECAGHRRSEFAPIAKGLQWGVGAVSEAVWTGARLADLLQLTEHGTATHVVLR